MDHTSSTHWTRPKPGHGHEDHESCVLCGVSTCLTADCLMQDGHEADFVPICPNCFTRATHAHTPTHEANDTP